MKTTDTSPADILDFRLLDEAGHPALNIEEEGHTPVLRLEIENVSSQRLTFPPASQNRAQRGEHHFSLSFRPGALSDETLARLSKPDPSGEVLGPLASDWNIQLERSRRAIDPVTLYFLCTSRGNSPSLAPSGDGENSLLTLELYSIAAAPGNGLRPTAAQMSVAGLYEGNRLKNWLRVQRRADLYITHAGGVPGANRPAAPPFRLDLLDDLVIPAGHKSKSVHLLLSNSSPDIPINGEFLELVVDIGEEDRWWALAASGEYDAADYANLTATPLGGRERLESPLEHRGEQGAPNALHWKIRLPNGRLGPGRGIDLHMALKTSRSGPLAIHIDSDLPNFGAHRKTVYFSRSGLSLRQLGSDVSKVKNRIATESKTIEHLRGELAKSQGQLEEHAETIENLKQTVNQLIQTENLSLGQLLSANKVFIAGSEWVKNHNIYIVPTYENLEHGPKVRLAFYGETPVYKRDGDPRWSYRYSCAISFPELRGVPSSCLEGVWYIFTQSEELKLYWLLELNPEQGHLYIRGIIGASRQEFVKELKSLGRPQGINVEDYLKKRHHILQSGLSVSYDQVPAMDLSKLEGPY